MVSSFLSSLLSEVPNMNKLSVATHSKVCRLVIDEDSTELHSLNQVSSYFHQVSNPYIHYRHTVRTVKRAAALIKSLKKLPPPLRQVRHLFMPTLRFLDTPSQEIMGQLLQLCAPSLHSLAQFSPLSGTSVTFYGSYLEDVLFPYLHDGQLGACSSSVDIHPKPSEINIPSPQQPRRPRSYLAAGNFKFKMIFPDSSEIVLPRFPRAEDLTGEKLAVLHSKAGARK